MKTPTVKVYCRIAQPDGSYPYKPAVYDKNHQISAGYALVDKKPQYHPEAVYYLRYSDASGKQVWERVGTDDTLVDDARNRKVTKLKAAATARAKGLPVPEPEPIVAPTVEDQAATSTENPLADAVTKYLADTQANQKSKNTVTTYGRALRFFQKCCKKTDPQAIDRDDLKTFMAFCRARGNVETTVKNQLNRVLIFLRDEAVAVPFAFTLKKWKALPKPAKKKPTTYTDEKWAAMLFHATLDESDLLHFLEGMGMRGGEAKHAPWTRLDLTAGRYLLAEYEGWQPKDKDPRVVEVADDLLARMRARRERQPNAKLIFAGPKGLPNLDILKIIKELAFRSKVNCGECHSKSKKKVCKKHPECATGLSCLHHPVCFNVIAHKTRKRFTAKMLQFEVDPTSIMKEAGWSSYETMKLYMADLPNPGLRAKKNRAFATS